MFTDLREHKERARVHFIPNLKVGVFVTLCAPDVINTAYIERFNLTIRNSLARFIRRGMNSSKDLEMHTHVIDFFQAWYNFVKPHKSLRVEVNLGRKRWLQRTPAMAEEITDHVWSLKELLTFRVPIQ